MHLRRYYTILAAAADLEGNQAAASVAIGMRAAVAGTALPSNFPARSALVAAGYPCVEDLPDIAADPDPADARAALLDELVRHGLAASDAALVTAAL